MIVGLLVEGLIDWFGSTTVFGWLCLLTCCVGWVRYGCFVCLLVCFGDLCLINVVLFMAWVGFIAC